MSGSRAKRSTEFNYRRLRSNLARHAVAMALLAEMGIAADLVDALGLGIKEPYERADGTEVHGVLAYPLDVAGRRRRYGYVNLQGVTTGAEHDVAWGPGAPATVSSGQGTTAVVVGSPVAAWQIGAAAARLGLQVVAIASSQPERVPEEWERPAFWARWDRLILAEGLPEAVGTRIVQAARRPVEAAPGVEPAQATIDVGVSRRHEEWLEEILACARVAARRVAVVDDAAEAPGDFAVEPMAVHGGFARGHLFYPYMVERRSSPGETGGGLLHSYQTLVLRSDGAVLEPQVLPAPAGTPAWRRVHALSDGTRIAAPPQPSRQSTWSLAAIERYASDRAAGVDPCARRSAEVLADVHAFLASRVRLPHPDDLWVAATFVFMTHVFRVFDAIPLLMVRGPRGSGKSELASAVVALGFNATLMGQGSAAALVRLTRECGGLVALDDAESLATDASGFGELGQCLKLGYKSSSARKPVTLGSGRVDTIDFFGPRLITTTRGVEPVLGSRCIEVATAPAAEPSGSCIAPEPGPLRDELHALAMSRAGDLAREYAALKAGTLDRHDEIWAPLRTIAGALGGDALAEAVERRFASGCEASVREAA